MTTAQLPPSIVFKAWDNTGLPLTGGMLYSYIGGTSTPQATYPSSSEFTPNTNPIVLNARGECSLWIDPTLTYKFNLTDASGNQIPGYPVDNIQGFSVMLGTYLPSALTQAIIGGVLYPQTTQEKTAGVTPTYYWYPSGNVLRYGADPSGVADSTLAFQQALNSVSYIVSPTSQAAALQGGGEVYVPHGLYTISSTLYINPNVHLVGEDCGPVQESDITTLLSIPIGMAVINYTSATQQSIAIDCSGFWLTSQNAYSGTASAGGASTITITTALTIGSAAYITLTGGTGAGQIRPIASYVSGTGVATVSWPWNTQPTNTTTWTIGGVALGSRINQLQSTSENAALVNGITTYEQGVSVKNLAIVTTLGQYMGLRTQVVVHGNFENLVIVGFQNSLESSGCSYTSYSRIFSEASLIAFGWVQGDHITRTLCTDFGVAATATPLTTTNRPWFVDYEATEGDDPNPSYWTAHYSFGEIGVYIACDGEGGDRSYYNQGSTNCLYLGCHMERFNQIGLWVSNNVSGAWIGGDWYSANTAPAFSGSTAYFTIESFSHTSGMGASAVTIGSFPNTYGGLITVRNTLPVGGDSAPTAGSLVVWDHYVQPGTASRVFVETPITTVGAGTLTAAGLVGGVILRTGPSGAFIDTTDTAANILAQFIPTAIVGSSFQCTYINKSSYTATLDSGSGVTFAGNLTSGSTTVASGASRVLTGIVTNISSAAVTIYG